MITGSSAKEKKNFEIRNENPESVFSFKDEFTKKKNQFNVINKQTDNLRSLQWKEAKKNIKQFRSPRTLEQLADVQFLRQNLSRAKKYYLEAIKLDNSLLAIYEKLIFIYLVEGNIEDADEYYKIILKITNKRPDYLHKYILFKLFFFNKEYTLSEAFKNIEEVVKKNQRDYTALNTYGFLYLKNNDLDNAILYFEMALKINPDFAHSLNNLGVCYQKKGQIKKSKNYYELAIKKDIFYVAPCENLANYYISIENSQNALDILTNAVDRGLILSDIWQHQIGSLYIKLHFYKKAIEWYRERIKIETKNDLLYNNLGYCYIQLGKIKDGTYCFNRAISIFKEKIIEKAPCDSRELLAFYNMGRIAVRTKKKDNIRKIYNEILNYSPNDAFADYLQGSEKILAGNYSEAKTFYLKSLEKRKDIPEVYPDLSFIFESIEENYQSAIKLLEEAIQMKLDNLLIVNNLIYAYIENGNLDKAEKLLDIFEGKIPPIIYANKGLLAFRKNDLSKGDYYYEKAMEGFLVDNRKIAEQYWLIEKCRYYIRKKDESKAKKYLLLLNGKKNTYMRSRIEKLEDDFIKIFS